MTRRLLRRTCTQGPHTAEAGASDVLRFAPDQVPGGDRGRLLLSNQQVQNRNGDIGDGKARTELIPD